MLRGPSHHRSAPALTRGDSGRLAWPSQGLRLPPGEDSHAGLGRSGLTLQQNERLAAISGISGADVGGAESTMSPDESKQRAAHEAAMLRASRFEQTVSSIDVLMAKLSYGSGSSTMVQAEATAKSRSRNELGEGQARPRSAAQIAQDEYSQRLFLGSSYGKPNLQKQPAKAQGRVPPAVLLEMKLESLRKDPVAREQLRVRCLEHAKQKRSAGSSDFVRQNVLLARKQRPRSATPKDGEDQRYTSPPPHRGELAERPHWRPGGAPRLAPPPEYEHEHAAFDQNPTPAPARP